jgi:hypothetical protein
MNRHDPRFYMNETLGAIVAGIALVLLSMICGCIIYALVRERVKRNISGNE